MQATDNGWGSGATRVLLLLSAPSGGGKSTVMEGLAGACPRLKRVITCTTRAPRAGERDGVDYLFLDPGEFSRRREAGEFLEHAMVYGNAYGTLRSSVTGLLEGGWDVVIALDVQGAATVRALAPREPVLGAALVSVFLTPGSAVELEARLRGRGSEPEEVVARRLEKARGEVARWREFDYLVVSGTRAEDLARVRAIYEAERLRVARARFGGMG